MEAFAIGGAIDMFGGMKEDQTLDAFGLEALDAPAVGMHYAEALSEDLARKLVPVLRALERGLASGGASVVAGIWVHPDKEVVVHTLVGGYEDNPAYHRVPGVRAEVLPLSLGVMGGLRAAFTTEEMEGCSRRSWRR